MFLFIIAGCRTLCEIVFWGLRWHSEVQSSDRVTVPVVTVVCPYTRPGTHGMWWIFCYSCSISFLSAFWQNILLVNITFCTYKKHILHFCKEEQLNFKYHIKHLVISKSLLKKLFQLIEMVDNVLKSDSQLDERVVSLYLDLVIKVDIVVGTDRCILTISS